MNKLTKTIGALALVGLMALVGSVFAYTKITTDISASINSEVEDVVAANVTTTATTITTTTTNIQTGLALIGNEVVNVTAGGGSSSLTVTRAQNGTTATVHSEGDTIRQLTQNVDVVFTPESHTLVATDEVIVTIPNHSPNSFGDMGTAVIGGSAATKDAAARTFTVSGLTGSAQITTAITGLVMPNTPGEYIIPVEIRSESGTLIEMGAAALSWANQVRVRAIIQPALVFTIDKTNIDITANPSVNDGENYTQKSLLSVATNAVNGYTIYGMLEGKNTTANAQLDDGANAIVAGDSSTVEKTFGYYAWDGNQTKDAATVKAAGGKAFDNNSAGSPSFKDVSGNDVGFNTFTNNHEHTVYYGVNVDYTIPSGEYEGLITYTATPSF